MKYTSSLLTAGLLATLTTATPTNTLEKRADKCGQWDSIQTGTYTVYNNLWGQSAGTGSQCFGVDGLSGTTLKWHASWSWSGGPQSVKSYPNAVVSLKPTQLSKISSIPSKWTYTSTGNSVVADVSYDMFTSSTANGENEYEVMIWLAAIGGAGPISSTYGQYGATPVATTTIAGTSWKLYKGVNGQMTVFSFVAEKQVTDFNADLKTFINYLTTRQGLPSNQYLINLGAGLEPFTGSNGKFTVTGYSTTIKYA